MCGRGDGVLGEQETGRLEGLADATGGVQPRREREATRSRGRRPRARPAPAPAVRRSQAGVSSQPLEAEPRDGPVLSTIGATSATVPIVARSVRSRAAPRAAEQQLGDLERDAAPREARVRVAAVGAVRVDDRQGRQQLRRDAVMVGDDDVDAARPSDGDLRRGARPAVDRDDDDVAPARAAASIAASDRPWPSSSRLGT